MKYFIIGPQASGKQEVIDHLEKLGVSCGKIFSNIDKPSPTVYNSNNYELYTTKDINEVFENNAYIFIQELQASATINSKNFYEGLSRYTFDNNDVFVISPDQFMSMSPNTIHEPICFVWMDNTPAQRKRRYLEDKRTYNFTERENIEKKDYCSFVKTLMSFNNSSILYFTNEEPCRVSTIIYSLIKHPDLLDVYKANFND